MFVMKNSRARLLSALSFLMCVTLTGATGHNVASRSTDHPVDRRGEKRPKNLTWGPSNNGLQMAAWASSVRPIALGIIRNNSRRKIHYCDYLLGTGVELFVRKSPSSDWVEISSVPFKRQDNIGVLLCGSNDTLHPGEKMKPSRTAFKVNSIHGEHTFEVHLERYEFPGDLLGTIECKIVQTIFGGDHEDEFEGKVESASFTLELPVRRVNDPP